MIRMSILAVTTVFIVGSGCDSRPKLSDSTAKALYQIAKANTTTVGDAPLGFSAMDWVVGQIPVYGRDVPLTSPDGRYLAVETGPKVGPETLLASSGARVPTANGVEIWKIDAPASQVSLTQRLAPPLLLGQSADERGFLVESPRPDGSRWIGKVSWTTGDIEWLVQDDQVNAFASLGPEGQLAWSTRAVNESKFALAVRLDSEIELGLGANGGEWIAPAWSTRTPRLSVFFLSDAGVLSLVSLDARSPQMLQNPPRQYDMMTGARRGDALTARLGHPVIQGSPAPTMEEVIFFHPVARSTYVWLPTSLLKKPPFALSPDSIAATNDPFSKGYLVATSGDLRWQDPDRSQAFVRVRYGSAMPRPTTSSVAPFLLFVPETNGLEIRAMVPRANSAQTVPAS